MRSAISTTLTAVIFLACVAVSLTAAIEVWRRGVPRDQPPLSDEQRREMATRQARLVVRRLAGENLGRKSQKRQLQLALDLETALGASLDDTLAELDPDERDKLAHNLGLVAPAWFMSKVDHYHALDAWEREQYLDRESDKIIGWFRVYLSAQFGSANPAESSRLTFRDLVSLRGLSGIMSLKSHVDDWSRRATPERRRRAERFLKALQGRFLKQTAAPGFPGR